MTEFLLIWLYVWGALATGMAVVGRDKEVTTKRMLIMVLWPVGIPVALLLGAMGSSLNLAADKHG